LDWAADQQAKGLDVSTADLEAELRIILREELPPDEVEAAIAQVMDLVGSQSLAQDSGTLRSEEGIAAFITTPVKEALKRRGFSAEEIFNMSPQRAQQILKDV
jgi:hypothetical protein